MILLSPPLPLWLFSGFSVCTSASNTLPLLFSSSGELSNSDPFKVSRSCPFRASSHCSFEVAGIWTSEVRMLTTKGACRAI